MTLLARNNSAIVNPTNITVEISHKTGFTSYVDACSIEHARAIAFVINNPELADIVINEEVIEHREFYQSHLNRFK